MQKQEGSIYMNRFIALFLALVGLLSSVAVSSAAEDKIGFIDAQRALMAHPKYEQSQKHLDEFVNKKTDEAKEAADKETDAEKRAMIIDNARRASGDEELRMMNPITADINSIIEKVAKSKGVTVVLNRVLIYYGGIDITDDVIKGLKELKF